jgi:radical SAM protein with 4Fe4S-binding SPASM domain
VDGSFQWTMEAARAIVARKLPLQIKTMVTAQTLGDLPAIYETLRDVGITRWALFFLIATGRGRSLLQVTPGQSEKLLGWLAQLSRDPATPFLIKTTEAPHYRRIAFRRMAQRMTPEQIEATPVGRGFGIRDGNGVVFVSFMGQVYPSGFLPLSAGNVRRESLVDVYRNSDLFRSLHDANQLKGKCGRCAFRTICGGSRARAYAATGDPLEADPLCPYQPPV